MSGYIAELVIKVDSSQVDSAASKIQNLTKSTEGLAAAEAANGRQRKTDEQQVDRLLGQIDRQTKSLNTLATQQRLLNKAHAEGKVSNETAEKYTSIIQAQVAKVRERGNILKAEADAERERLDKWYADAAKQQKAEVQRNADRITALANESKARQAAQAQFEKDEENRYKQTLIAGDRANKAELKQQQDAAAAREQYRKDVNARVAKQEKDAADAQLSAQKALEKEQQAIDKRRYNSTLQRFAQEKKAAEQNEQEELNRLARQQKERDALVREFDPTSATLSRLAERRSSLEANKGSYTQEQYERISSNLDAARDKALRYKSALSGTALSAKQLQMAQAGLPAQFTDIIVSLQGGQAPLTVFLQQGGQIKDMFGGVKPALKGVAEAVMGLVNPWTVAAAAAAAFFLLMKNGEGELAQLQNALITTGNEAGKTAGQLATMARDLAEQGSGSIGKNTDALEQLVQSAKVPPELFEKITKSAVGFSSATGLALDKVIDDFTSLGDEPVKAAEKLNEKYNFLTSATHAQMQALVEQGREQDAAKLAMNEYADVMADRTNQINDNLGILSRSWNFLAKQAKAGWDAMLDIGRKDSLEEQLRQVNDQIEKASKEGNFGRNGRLSLGIVKDDLLAKRDDLVAKIYEQRTASQESAKAVAQETAGITANGIAARAYKDSLDGVAKAKQKLDEYNRKVAESGPEYEKAQAAKIAETRKLLQAEIKKAEEAKAKKGPHSAIIDDTDVNDLQNKVAEIKAQYKLLNEGINEQEKSGTVSREAAFAKRKKLLDDEKAKITEAYTAQISALESLKNSKNISANQSIALDRKIADARSKMVIAQTEAEKELTKLAADEQSRIKKQTLAISSYQQAVNDMVENLERAGERQRAALGMSSGQAGLQDQLNAEDDRYNQEYKTLSLQVGEEGRDQEEVQANLRAAAEGHTRMKKQIVANYNEMKAAQMDYSVGIKSAFEQYIEDGQNYAQMTNQVFTNAFRGMEDAIVQFATTGKASFSDFARSIMADMVRMAAQIAASRALAGILGAFAGPAAPAAQSMGSATAMNMGVLAAKGRAYNNGTQFFAKGGAFTNTIVSKPTAFSTNGSDHNIMGEAGPEAIMPLTRASDGSLGVRASVDLSGLQQGGGNNVQVIVNVDGQGNTTSSSSDPGYSSFGNDIGQFVDQRYKQLISKDLQPGGDIWKSMQT